MIIPTYMSAVLDGQEEKPLNSAGFRLTYMSAVRRWESGERSPFLFPSHLHECHTNRLQGIRYSVECKVGTARSRSMFHSGQPPLSSHCGRTH